MNQNWCRKCCFILGKKEWTVSCLKVEPSQLHGIPGLILLTAWYAQAVGHFRGFVKKKKKEKKDFVLKLKTILKFALIQSAVIGLYHKDTISNDVYDSRMVFYNVFVFRWQAFYTAFKCVCYFFVPIESTNVNSIFAMFESPWRFCTSQNFCNSDLFVVTYMKWTKNIKSGFNCCIITQKM